MSGERGRINGNDVFHLSYPGDWSECFTLTSPLIFLGDREGWLGSIEVADPGPEVHFEGKVTVKKTRAALAEEKERWEKAKNATKAVAEAILVDFARSVMNEGGES